ncbi:DUF616 domain-containing protein [Chlorobaculum thiosulfatiphilum]|uniref:DUF616 domain-containing protein n=1 Tax=Chlorobaculum thiosulfatiphilum TaxID=115852 RepID=A0A5C4S357_CHLTI|nr:glycosyltransferase domain-containing protein [Chlorobaculum thiosulfatiphilum]TNJ37582.1 DUF616 domain-containing protein [Chlorobaculum thiosulfatiphilum]
MNSRIVVYTALFGEYDDLKNPPEPIDGCDFVCFTNNRKLRSGAFDIRYFNIKDMDNTRRNRMVKLLPHRFFPDHEYSLYIDGSVSIKRADIRDFALRHLVKHDWAVFSHSSRNCIYEELEACIERQKDDPVTMRRQIEHYRRNGHPEKYGLTENTILLRRHNQPNIIRFSELWWQELQRHSKRDQLSFAYVARNEQLEYALLPGTIRNNDHFEIHTHKHKKTPVQKLLKSLKKGLQNNKI